MAVRQCQTFDENNIKGGNRGLQGVRSLGKHRSTQEQSSSLVDIKKLCCATHLYTLHITITITITHYNYILKFHIKITNYNYIVKFHIKITNYNYTIKSHITIEHLISVFDGSVLVFNAFILSQLLTNITDFQSLQN